MELLEGACYLIKEPKPVLSFGMLRLLAKQGTPSFGITRVLPAIARERFDLNHVRLAWLADAPGEDVIRPGGIVALSKAIETFVEQNPEGSAVLVDGLEFLVIRNGFDAVLLFVEHLNEFVVRTRAIALLPLSPETLEPKQVAQLERDLEVPDAVAWRAELDAREWSRRLGS